AVPRVDRVRGTHSFTTTAQLCAAYAAQKPKEPLLAFYATPQPSHMAAAFNPRETGEFGLQVVNAPDSLGEVVMLKTLFAILNEWGTPALRVRLNTLGDRDSKARFERELSGFTRKRSHELAECCRDE